MWTNPAALGMVDSWNDNTNHLRGCSAMPVKKAKRGQPKWDDSLYVQCYKYALAGMSDAEIAKALNVNRDTILDWRKARPALDDALDDARSSQTSKGSPPTYLEYIYKRLPPDAQQVWDNLYKLGSMDSIDQPTTAQIDAIFSPHPVIMRQRLFLHAMVANSFNQSAACATVGISKDTLQSWLADSPTFANLCSEMQWHQKNFFESSLVSLVAAGDSAATIYAAKTQLADRGYGDKSTVQLNIEGKMTHDVQLVDIDNLDIRAAAERLGVQADVPQILRILLQAIRDLEQKNREELAIAKAAAIPSLPGPMGAIIDATTRKAS